MILYFNVLIGKLQQSEGYKNFWELKTNEQVCVGNEIAFKKCKNI